MAEKYQAYPEYKDSGVEWLPLIPAGWQILPLKFASANKVKDGPHETPIFLDEGVPFLSVDSILDNKIVFIGCRFISYEDHERYSRKCLPKFGDILLGKAASVGKVAFVDVNEEFNVWSPLAVLTPKSVKLGKFIFYCLQSNWLQAQCDVNSNSNTQKNLSMGDIDNLSFAIPSDYIAEQIANFLDHETAKIDTLIEKQQQLITLLKEKRQAVISNAVTKGLNPNAPMRDSGVEWLGEVPAHWVIKKLKFACSFITKKVDIGNKKTIALENIESWSGKYIATDSVYAGEDVEFKSGDILFGKLRPYLAKVYFAKEDGVAFGDLLVYRAKPNLLGKYCFYQMINEAFINTVDSSTYGSKMPRASAEFINEMEVLLPPIQEQEAIVTHIEFVLYKYNEVEAKAKSAINLLQERRTALISAAVTGKIDVRDWQAPEPLNNTGNKALAA